MSRRKPENLAHSVRQRLLNKAREEGRPFGEVLQYFGMERFLYRLSVSPFADRFVLKGGFLLWALKAPITRSTRDIDLLGRTGNSPDSIMQIFKDILTIPVEADGLVFDVYSLKASLISEDADYHGIRLLFSGQLGEARIPMQVDIGFGDVVFPGPLELELPVLLGQPPAKMFCYSLESVIAEKYETMLRFGELNSRIKDFFDVWLLARQYDFKGEILSAAIGKTFRFRGASFPLGKAFFTEGFFRDKQAAWKAFLVRSHLDFPPVDFVEIGSFLNVFISPVAESVRGGDPFGMEWRAPGPWS